MKRKGLSEIEQRRNRVRMIKKKQARSEESAKYSFNKLHTRSKKTEETIKFSSIRSQRMGKGEGELNLICVFFTTKTGQGSLPVGFKF